jgi:hypothetical protein
VLDVLRSRREDAKVAATKAENKKAAKAAADDIDSKLFMKPTTEQVDEQWGRALVKKGLAMDLVDDKEFRLAVLMTARAGLSYVDGAQGDTKLPGRFKFSKKVIPALDDKLDADVGERIEGLNNETGELSCWLTGD